MADPVVASVSYASLRGYLDLTKYDDSPAWWREYELRMYTVSRLLDAQVVELDAHRMIAELSVNNVNTDDARSYAKERVRTYERLLQPWKGKAGLPEADSNVDLAARWYILNAPQVLESLGVDLSGLK